MATDSSLTDIVLGDQVCFTQERLSMLTPGDRKRLEGRVGMVEGYWGFTKKLTVSFPRDAGRPLLRILSVDPRQLERVAESVATEPEMATDNLGESKLSQDDTDALFG